MKIRETLNTESGYNEIIESKKNYIAEDLLEIDELLNDERLGIQNHKRPNTSIIIDTKKDILSHKRVIIEGSYSLGVEVYNLMDEFKDTIKLIVEVWQSDWGYVQMVDALSIGIMLNIEDSEFEKLISLVERDNVNDFLIDFLIQYRRPSWKQTEKFLWNKPYKNSIKIIEDSKIDNEKAISSLKKYLKSWYSSLEVKTHESKWNIHTGYWSWEAGAIAKILGLDDSSLKDQPYYPYDMVHYKD